MTSSELPGVGMNPQRLRTTIMRAAIPLLAEWNAVTTARLAHAAGIDEATFLTVFTDKDAALTAALQELMMTALDTTQVVRQLQAIPRGLPVATRLTEAVEALDAYHGRIVTVLAPLDASDAPQSRPTPDRGTAGEPGTQQANREDFRAAARLDVIRDAVADLLEPDEEHLRLSIRTLADAFLGLYSGRKRTLRPEPSPLPAGQLVDLFLHGAMTSTDQA
jgi:AcrR family transcriptional regulator